MTGKWTWSNYVLFILFWQVSVNLSLDSQLSLDSRSLSGWSLQERNLLTTFLFYCYSITRIFEANGSRGKFQVGRLWPCPYVIFIVEEHPFKVKKLTKTLLLNMDVKFLLFYPACIFLACTYFIVLFLLEKSFFLMIFCPIIIV